MQRVGFDRVDFGAAPAGDVGGDKAKQQSAEARREKCVERIERDPARQPLAGIEAEKSWCMRPTASPMAATTRPAMTPTTTASTMMLDSRARTIARRRCGTSSGGLNKRIRNRISRRVRAAQVA